MTLTSVSHLPPYISAKKLAQDKTYETLYFEQWIASPLKIVGFVGFAFYLRMSKKSLQETG